MNIKYHTFSNCTSSDIKEFIKWAKSCGFLSHKTYKYESSKRALTLTNGIYTCLIINRPMLHKSRQEHGHNLTEDIILMDCGISCFKNGQPFNGNSSKFEYFREYISNLYK